MAARGGVFFKLLVALVAMAAITALAWMVLLPSIVTDALRERTGFSVSVRSLVVNPFAGTIHARGLVLGNPAAFPRPEFVEVRELQAQVELGSLYGGQIVIKEASLDIARLTLVQPSTGESNDRVFQARLVGRGAFVIKRLVLRCDKLVLVDQAGETPGSRETNLGLNQTYTNVRSSAQLAGPVLGRAEALGATLGAWAGQLKADAAVAAKKAGEAWQAVERKAEESLPGIFPSLDQRPKK